MLRNYFVASICAITSCAYGQQAEPEGLRRLNEILYGHLKRIENFGFIHVHVKNPDDHKLGLSSGDLSDYLKLRFKNNFANVGYQDAGDLTGVRHTDRVGYLWCGVWTVGADYPVAYHVECRLGSLDKPDILKDEVLGFGNKTTVPGSVRQALDSMVSKFAVQFFKLRREL